MKRVYEVGFEAKLNGGWSGKFSRRTVIVVGGASDAIAKAEKLEQATVTAACKDAGEKVYPIRAEYASFITDAE